MKTYERRDILRLLSVSGVTFASGLWGCAGPGASARTTVPLAPAVAGGPPPAAQEDFMFLQLSDTHWGFSGPPNPEADRTLRSTIATINAVAMRPDFVIFTGDLTHTTDDPELRRRRMKEFKAIVAELDVKDVRFIPGEHDASLDGGEAYREFFGETHYAFEHKGVHFLALDNVSDPAVIFGAPQLAWLQAEVAKVPTTSPLVVFAHRPLFDLYPAWEWATQDGAKAIEILQAHPSVNVFYGHIHQEHRHQTGRIMHYAARSLVFPLPAPGSVQKKAPLPWDSQSPDHGLGYREVDLTSSTLTSREHPFAAPERGPRPARLGRLSLLLAAVCGWPAAIQGERSMPLRDPRRISRLRVARRLRFRPRRSTGRREVLRQVSRAGRRCLGL